MFKLEGGFLSTSNLPSRAQVHRTAFARLLPNLSILCYCTNIGTGNSWKGWPPLQYSRGTHKTILNFRAPFATVKRSRVSTVKLTCLKFPCELLRGMTGRPTETKANSEAGLTATAAFITFQRTDTTAGRAAAARARVHPG